MSHYRFSSRSKQYTKAWWEKNVAPVLLAAGLVEDRRYADAGLVFHVGTLTADEALALRKKIDGLKRRVSIGVRFDAK